METVIKWSVTSAAVMAYAENARHWNFFYQDICEKKKHEQTIIVIRAR